MLDILRRIRLIWRLMRDRQVSGWIKFIPLVGLLYVLMPVDLIPEPIMGIGMVDDIVLMLMSLKLFETLVPPGATERARGRPSVSRPPNPDAEVIDASYRVLDDNEP